MVSEYMEYEKSLEMMNEEGLRSECLRLHEQLMIATKKLLTQPVSDTRSEDEVQSHLEDLIEQNRKNFREICQKDMSEPTTAEINSVRELRRLIKRRNN